MNFATNLRYFSESSKLKSKKEAISLDDWLLFSRDYWTRTSDLAPPRRVRYQLR